MKTKEIYNLIDVAYRDADYNDKSFEEILGEFLPTLNWTTYMEIKDTLYKESNLAKAIFKYTNTFSEGNIIITCIDEKKGDFLINLINNEEYSIDVIDYSFNINEKKITPIFNRNINYKRIDNMINQNIYGENKKLSINFYGDSIMFGAHRLATEQFGAVWINKKLVVRSTPQSVKNIPATVKTYLEKLHPTLEVTVNNYGMPGAGSKVVFNGTKEDEYSDLSIIALGANDIFHMLENDAEPDYLVQDWYRKLIEKRLNQGSNVILGIPTLGRKEDDNVEYIRAMIYDLAKEYHLPLFDGKELTSNYSLKYYADYIHLNDLGLETYGKSLAAFICDNHYLTNKNQIQLGKYYRFNKKIINFFSSNFAEEYLKIGNEKAIFAPQDEAFQKIEKLQGDVIKTFKLSSEEHVTIPVKIDYLYNLHLDTIGDPNVELAINISGINNRTEKIKIDSLKREGLIVGEIGWQFITIKNISQKAILIRGIYFK